jgi:hypothetical protein
MPAEQKHKINLGLLGLGRLGKVYARALHSRLPVEVSAVTTVDT